MIKRIDRDYANYFGLDNSIDLEKKKGKIPFENWIENKKIEKAVIADVIKKETNANNLIEFCNCYYIDDDKRILSPTISENFISEDEYAMIMSPYINTKFLRNLSIIKLDKNNFEENYNTINKNTNLNTCIISESNLDKLINYYKIWLEQGISCAYIISDNKNKEFMRKQGYVDSVLINTLSSKKHTVKKMSIDSIYGNRLTKLYLLSKKRTTY